MRSSMTRDCQPRGCQRRGYQPRGYQRRVLLLGARTWACLLVLGTVMVGVPAGAQAADAPPKKTAQPQADAPQAEAPRVEPTADELSRMSGLSHDTIDELHGAGLLADKRIEDKTTEQFERVFRTKVDGLRVLLSATRTTP